MNAFSMNPLLRCGQGGQTACYVQDMQGERTNLNGASSEGAVG